MCPVVVGCDFIEHDHRVFKSLDYICACDLLHQSFIAIAWVS